MTVDKAYTSSYFTPMLESLQSYLRKLEQEKDLLNWEYRETILEREFLKQQAQKSPFLYIPQHLFASQSLNLENFQQSSSTSSGESETAPVGNSNPQFDMQRSNPNSFFS